MKKIKIVHLYSDSLDLYGDVFNIKVIERKAKRNGYECEIVNINQDDEINLSDADMVYIGHGKDRNLNSVAQHFLKYKEEILNAVEKGKVFLSIGNSRLLFGKSFKDENGKNYEGIGLFSYNGVENEKVFVSDVVSQAEFDENIITYGFINRTAYIENNNEYPLFKILRGAGEHDKVSKKDNGVEQYEGNHYKNFFGTWQIGPILARNPQLAECIAEKVIPEYSREEGESLSKEALKRTLKEFDL